MCYLGLDVGSLSCDAVLINLQGDVLASAVVPTGADNLRAIAEARDRVLEAAGVTPGRIEGTVSTGYGRNRVADRHKAVTEISCHARGIRALNQEVDLLIDIGGQDSKVVLMGPGGKVLDFAMNDKCAAGTGRFLEAMARVLDLEIAAMVELDQGAAGEVNISSTCTVFAESEVVSLVARGEAIREIVSGLNRSVASRTLSLLRRICSAPQGVVTAMSGGVARNSGVVRALEQALGSEIFVPADPDIVGALGAALIARQECGDQGG